MGHYFTRSSPEQITANLLDSLNSLGEAIEKKVVNGTVHYAKVDAEDQGALHVLKTLRKKVTIHKNENGEFKVRRWVLKNPDKVSKSVDPDRTPYARHQKEARTGTHHVKATEHEALDYAHNWLNKLHRAEHGHAVSVVRYRPDSPNQYEVSHSVRGTPVEKPIGFKHMGDAKKAADKFVKQNGALGSSYEYFHGKPSDGNPIRRGLK